MSRTDTGTPNDKVRQAVLDHLYSIYKKSSLKGNWTKISEIKTALKKQGFKESEIAAALYYLIKTEFAEEVKERYPISRGGKIIRVESISYRISDTGIITSKVHPSFRSRTSLLGLMSQISKELHRLEKATWCKNFRRLVRSAWHPQR